MAAGRQRYSLIMVVRDIQASWTQFVAVFCMACMSVAAYTGLEGAWNGLKVNLDQFQVQAQMADLWVSVTGVGDQQLAQITALSSVTDVEVRHEVTARLTTPGSGQVWVTLTVMDDPGNWAVSVPQVITGPGLTGTGSGVWLGDRLASTSGLALGDGVDLSSSQPSGSAEVSVPLIGTVMSPDQVYNVRPSDLTMPDPSLFGYGYITAESAQALFGAQPATSTTILVRTDHTVPISTLDQQLRAVLGNSRIVIYDRDTNPTVATAFTRVSTIQNLSVLFSSLFILVAVLAMYTSTRRLVDAQAKHIGTLRALGFGRGELIRHFSRFGLVAGIAGVVVGLMVAPLLSQAVLSSQKPQFELPHWSIAYTPVPILVAVLVIASCVLGSALAARSCTRGEPATLLRPGVPMTSQGTSGLGPRLIRRASYPLRWAFRDGLANPVRILMGVAGIVGSSMLLFAGFGLPDTIQGEAHDSYSTAQAPYFARVDLAAGVTAEQVGQMPAMGTSPQLLMQVSVSTKPGDGSDVVLTVVGPGDLYPVQSSRGDALAGAGFWLNAGAASRLGLGVSDPVVVFAPMGIASVQATITGTTIRSAPQGLFVTQAEWEAAGQSFHPTCVLVRADADLDALGGSSAVSFVVTRSTQYDNALTLLTALTGIFMVLRVFAVVLTVVVLYSLGSLTFDERKRQYATLKVLGLENKELRRLSLVDNAFVTIVGLVIGIPAGVWFLSAYVRQFDTNLLHYTTRITPASVLIALLLIVLVSSLTTVLLGRRVGRVNVVEALKEVE
ncbi:MAG: FtsX-like permease family protein [Propionibacteriaceae bacterium]|nr:FtsX-like permease family protein [Propionibacteriaceae bacterium]